MLEEVGLDLTHVSSGFSVLFVQVGLNSTIFPLLMQAVSLSSLPRVFCVHFKFLLIHPISFFIFKHLNEGLHFLPTATSHQNTPHTHVPLSAARRSRKHSRRYLHYPNECFQLVDVQLQVHAVRQPGADDVHRAGVPLLQERQHFSSTRALQASARRDQPSPVPAR